MIASVRHVTYTYPGRDAPALCDASVALDPGEFVLLVGESGSGKSTLLRLFNGLVPQFHGGRYGGEVRVTGLDPSLTPARTMATVAGMVFQEPESQGIADTVEADVAFGMEQRAVPRAEMLARAARLLDELGIAHLRHRRLATLSGGERQRAAIAAVLALEPRILLLDEPVSQLDAAGAAAVATTLSGLAARGLAVVVAEHRLDHFLPRAGTIWSTRQGRLSASAQPGDSAGPATVEAMVEARPMRGPGDVLVRARDLSVAFPGGGGITGIDLAVREGEIVALTGLNGSGKTTLLRGLAGLVRPSGGGVELGGRPAPSSLAERSAQLGYVPQDPAVVLYRETVLDELRDSLRRRMGAPSPGAALDTWGLRLFAQRNPRDLSVGEQQRVAIAAMLAHAPRAWLLDEPTRGADVATRTWLAERIRAQAAAGGAVVVATHDHRWAAGFATRIVTLESGRVSADAIVDASREPALRPAAVAHR